MSACVHLVVGPVGAGKSTFAASLARDERAVRLTLDDWYVRLFAPDRPDAGVWPWYRERTGRCLEVIWLVALEVLGAGTPVVLEIGLLTRAGREAFYARVREAGARLELHVIDAPREVRRERVRRRNEERGPTFHALVSDEVFELASDLWEPVDDGEREGCS